MRPFEQLVSIAAVSVIVGGAAYTTTKRSRRWSAKPVLAGISGYWRGSPFRCWSRAARGCFGTAMHSSVRRCHCARTIPADRCWSLPWAYGEFASLRRRLQRYGLTAIENFNRPPTPPLKIIQLAASFPETFQLYRHPMQRLMRIVLRLRD